MRHLVQALGTVTALFLVMSFTPSNVAAQTDEAAVKAVVAAFHGALASGDSTVALSHLAEDVAILEGSNVESKEHYRSGHLRGDMRFAQAVSRVRGEMTVTIIGDVAWVTSTNTTKGKIGDREIDSKGAELVVLARDGGTWKIRAIQWS